MSEVATMNFRKLRPEAELPKLDGWEVGVLVRSCLISETGRPSKVLIPPQSTRPVYTGLAVEVVGGATLTMYTSNDLALRSIFVVPKYLSLDPLEPLFVTLYNGSHQSYYVEHEEPIARLVLVGTMFIKVGEALP